MVFFTWIPALEVNAKQICQVDGICLWCVSGKWAGNPFKGCHSLKFINEWSHMTEKFRLFSLGSTYILSGRKSHFAKCQSVYSFFCLNWTLSLRVRDSPMLVHEKPSTGESLWAKEKVWLEIFPVKVAQQILNPDLFNFFVYQSAFLCRRNSACLFHYQVLFSLD